MTAFPEEFSSLLIRFPVKEGRAKNNQFSYLLQNDDLTFITKKLRNLHREVT